MEAKAGITSPAWSARAVWIVSVRSVKMAKLVPGGTVMPAAPAAPSTCTPNGSTVPAARVVPAGSTVPAGTACPALKLTPAPDSVPSRTKALPMVTDAVRETATGATALAASLAPLAIVTA